MAESTSTRIAANSSGSPAPTRISWCAAAGTLRYPISWPEAFATSAAYSGYDQATSPLSS